MFDLPALAVGDHPHADPDDHKHVEGSTADDGSWTQLASLEFVTTHLQKVCNRERKDKSTYHLHLNKRYTELLCVCTSITESSISGALEPRAMSVRLDTVSFQIRTVITDVSPLGIVMVTSFSCWPKHTICVTVLDVNSLDYVEG